MPVEVQCPNSECGKTYRVAEEILGRRVRCKSCDTTFTAKVAVPSDEDDEEGLPPFVPSKGYEFLCLDKSKDANVVRIGPERVNAENVENVGQELTRAAEALAGESIILDLARVRFLFSDAMGKLISLEKKVQGLGGRMVLCNVQPFVAQALQVAGLNLLFEIQPDEAAAIATL